MKRLLAHIMATASVMLVARVPAAIATLPGSDGSIVYTRAHAARAISEDGTEDHLFSSIGRSIEAVSFSADGNTAAVAMTTTRHRARIVLLDLVNDTRSVVLSVKDAPTAAVVSIALSPDDSSIVFCDGYLGHLWTVGTDGSALTKVRANGYCFADWGSSGRIVASKGIFPEDGDRLVTTMDPDGSNKEVISRFPRSKPQWGFLYILRPSWAPDSSAVVFGGQRHRTHPDIWWVAADGAGRRKLTDTASRSETGPIFSPDGTNVFSKLDTEGRDWDLRLMGSDGRNLGKIVNTPTQAEAPLAWLPH